LEEGKSVTTVDECDFFRSFRSLFTTEVIYVVIYISLCLNSGAIDGGQQSEWIGERDQVDIAMATGRVCLGDGTTFCCACARWRGDHSGMRGNSSSMNATRHTGVSSGLHDILAIIGIKLRFAKKSTPYYLDKCHRISSACGPLAEGTDTNKWLSPLVLILLLHPMRLAFAYYGNLESHEYGRKDPSR
jgi:hypothetical protein